MTSPRYNSLIHVAILFLTLFCAHFFAHGDLILTNFSVAHPIKVMAIGDSITDDCSINGAYRYYLQPLLESSGIPFVFVGRQASSPAPPVFTKVFHEGYCGSVIAPPGVFAVHGYSTTDAYLLKIIADALAIPSIRPDVVLLFIGVNDIGHGRDPYYVATNDMPALLDLILTNAPGVHIIVGKATSIQGANASGLTYDSYSTNIPIYNATLQTMINSRHAAGQNVYLADMYSAVDYSSMFLSDHLHPNSTGLRAMANEWLTRILSFVVRTNLFTASVVPMGSTWQYFDGGREPDPGWSAPDYDDSSWSRGPSRFGYGDLSVATTVSFGSDPTNKYITTYFRNRFVLPWNFSPTNLTARLSRPNGIALTLNGQEVYRAGLPAGTLAYTNLANIMFTGYLAQVSRSLPFAFTNLVPGTNLLTAEIHQSSPTNAVLGFEIELISSGYVMPAPALAINLLPGAVQLSWPASNSQTFSLFSAPGFSPSTWIPNGSAIFTNGSQLVTTQLLSAPSTFFRLQQR